jgi:hypothetical protein
MNRTSFIRASVATSVAVSFLRSVALGSEATGYAPEMAGVVTTILGAEAFGSSSVSPESIVRRLNWLFSLHRSPAFLASLNAFSDIASFAYGSELLFDSERAQGAVLDTSVLLAHDAAALRATAIQGSTFEGLDAAERAQYLELWEHSAFNVRRRFYNSVRAVTFIAFYSMPESWKAIGYAGPMLAPKRAS